MSELSPNATSHQHEEAWAKIHDLLAAGHWMRARAIFDQAVEQDAKDAARYRWLRKQQHVDIAACWFLPAHVKIEEDDLHTPGQIDAAIDQEIARVAR